MLVIKKLPTRMERGSVPYALNPSDSYSCHTALFSAFTLMYDCRVRPGLFHAGVDETRRPPLTPLRHIDADAP